MKTVKELREEFAKLREEADKVINEAIGANRDLTADEQKANDERFARLEQIQKLINEQTRFAKMALEAAAAGAATIIPPIDPADKAELERALAAQQAFANGRIDRVEFSRAVGRWASTGVMDQKFATITTASQSGIFLPVEVVQPLVPIAPNTFRQAFALYGLPVMTTQTTAEINVPVLTSTAGGAVAENATSETESEPGLTGSIVSKPATYQSGSSWFSNNVLAAQDFDMISSFTPAWLQNKELGLEAAIATTIIGDGNITQVVTTASPTAISVADLAALDQILPKRYQTNKVIVLSQSAYAAACALTFASGPFVLTTDANGIRRYNGTPVLRCDTFQAVSATNITGCCLSLNGFHLRDAGQSKIIRYVDIPTKPDQSGFDLIGYHAYGYDPAAMALLKQHA